MNFDCSKSLARGKSKYRWYGRG